MAGYQVPTFDGIQQFLVGLFKSLFPNRNIGSRFSWYWKMIQMAAAAVTDIHAHVDRNSDEVMPDTATGARLVRWLAINGTALKTATPARKAQAGRLMGTPGAPFTIGALLRHRATNQTFQLNQSGVIGGAGYTDVDILAVSLGSSTRLNAGEVLEFIAMQANIRTNVELQLALDEDGADVEIDGAAQVRLAGIMGTTSAGGNQGDYVNWLVAQPNVTAGYGYPNRGGGGAVMLGGVDLVAFHPGSGSTRVLNTGERAVLLAAIAKLAPSQVGGTGGPLRILTTVGEPVKVELLIMTDGQPSSAWDWDDTTVPLVDTWVGTSRTIKFQSARPPTMKAGDRVVIKPLSTAVNQMDGAPMIIDTLVGTDSITLQLIPTRPDGTTAFPNFGDKVYAGGQLTATVRSAIIAHINGETLYTGGGGAGPIAQSVAVATGLSINRMVALLAGIGPSNPGGIYGAWNGELTVTALQTIAAATRGVRKASVAVPATDVGSTDYSYPLDYQIGFLIPDNVVVRRG